MSSFIQLVPYYSLKNIFGQLEELILWGYYLQGIDGAFYPDPHDTAAAMEELVTALKSHKPVDLAYAYEKVFSLIYKDVCEVVSQASSCSGLLSIKKQIT